MQHNSRSLPPLPLLPHTNHHHHPTPNNKKNNKAACLDADAFNRVCGLGQHYELGNLSVLELMQRLAAESRPSVVADALSLGVCAVPAVSL